MGGNAEDVHVPGCHLHDEQYARATGEDRVSVEEVAGRQPVRLWAQEHPPGGRDLASSRSAGQTAGHGHCAEFWSSTRPDVTPRPGGRQIDADACPSRDSRVADLRS